MQQNLRDDEEPIRIDYRVSTKRNVAWRFDRAQADAGLEPLAFGIDQRYQGNRRAADIGGKARQAVE